MRLWDFMSDWGFFGIAVQSPRLAWIMEYNGRSHASFEAWVLFFCIVATLSFPVDIYGYWERSTAMRLKQRPPQRSVWITVAVICLEDLPQLILAGVYTDAIKEDPTHQAEVDPTSIISIVFSVLGILVNVALVLRPQWFYSINQPYMDVQAWENAIYGKLADIMEPLAPTVASKLRISKSSEHGTKDVADSAHVPSIVLLNAACTTPHDDTSGNAAMANSSTGRTVATPKVLSKVGQVETNGHEAAVSAVVNDADDGRATVGGSREHVVAPQQVHAGNGTGCGVPSHADSRGNSRAGATAATDGARMTSKATRILTKKLGREPTEKEIAKKVQALHKKASAASASDVALRPGDTAGQPDGKVNHDDSVSAPENDGVAVAVNTVDHAADGRAKVGGPLEHVDAPQQVHIVDGTDRGVPGNVDDSRGQAESAVANGGGGSRAGAKTATDGARMMSKATRILTKKLGREPTEKEIAKKVRALHKKATAASASDAGQRPDGTGGHPAASKSSEPAAGKDNGLVVRPPGQTTKTPAPSPAPPPADEVATLLILTVNGGLAPTLHLGFAQGLPTPLAWLQQGIVCRVQRHAWTRARRLV